MNTKDRARPELCQKLVELGIVVPDGWDAWWWEVGDKIELFDNLYYDGWTFTMENYNDKMGSEYAVPAFSGTCLGWVLDKLKTAAIPSWGRSWTHKAEPDDRANYLICVVDTQEDNIPRINQLLQEWVK